MKTDSKRRYPVLFEMNKPGISGMYVYGTIMVDPEK
jgi:hypothetical protein